MKKKFIPKKNVLRGTRLNYSAAIQNRYVKEIKSLVKKMTSETTRDLIKLFKGEIADNFFEKQQSLMALDKDIWKDIINDLDSEKEKRTYEHKSLSYKAKILLNSLTKKYDTLFLKESKKIAEKMVVNTSKYSTQQIKNSVDKVTEENFKLKSGLIKPNEKEIYRSLVEENVNYITSISDEYFKNVTGAVMRSISEGKGLPDLVPTIEKSLKQTQGKSLKYYDEQAARRAKNIGLDQTRKAFTAINKQKCLNVGFKKFEWSHSYGGQHPRKSHIKIDGHIFSFENLEAEQAALGVPEADRSLPSFVPNCKCTLVPIMDFEL